MTDQAPARISVPEPLWMMHVIGPDDLYPAPDHATAVQWCAYLNREIAPKVPEVLCVAVPAVWTGSPEEHAEGLPEAIKGWTLPAAATEVESGEDLSAHVAAAISALTVPASSDAGEAIRGEVTDDWADRFCEAVNWSPDGQECKSVEGQMRCVSFRDLAKGYILSAIATQPGAALTTPAKVEAVPVLTVWYGSMPESNGRENWTATIRRVNPTDKWDQGFCFARSEYPDRVLYEADRMRWIIGERAERPDILAYDADRHSGYVEPTTPAAASDKLREAVPDLSSVIAWLANGCDPKHAVTELTIYKARIDRTRRG